MKTHYTHDQVLNFRNDFRSRIEVGIPLPLALRWLVLCDAIDALDGNSDRVRTHIVDQLKYLGYVHYPDMQDFIHHRLLEEFTNLYQSA